MSKNSSLQVIIDLTSEFSRLAIEATVTQLDEFKNRIIDQFDKLDEDFLQCHHKMMAEIQSVIKFYQNDHARYARDIKGYPNFFAQINQYYANMLESKDFDQLDVDLDTFITYAQIEESSLVICDYRLSSKLSECQQKFRTQGLLPRHFKRDLQPLILKTIDDVKRAIRVDSDLVSWNEKLIECLQNSLEDEGYYYDEFPEVVKNEEELDELLGDVLRLLSGKPLFTDKPKTKRTLQSIIEQLKQTGTLNEINFVGLFRMSTRKATENALKKFQDDLREMGWLDPGMANVSLQKQQLLQKLLLDIDKLTHQRKMKISEQFEALVLANDNAIINYIQAEKFSPAVHHWLTNKITLLNQTVFFKIPSQEEDIQIIRTQYQEFWLGLLHNVDETAKAAQQNELLHKTREQSDWLKLRDKVYMAVSYLKSTSHILPKQFSDFDIKCVIRELNSRVEKTYQFSLIEQGDQRKRQLLELESRLLKYGDNPVAVGMIIDQEILRISTSHNSQSYTHNFTLWSRNSRSATVLSNFLNDCVRCGWAIVPEESKIKRIEAIMQNHITAYFNQFLFSSLVQRKTVGKILDAIYHVKIKMIQEKNYTEWQGLNEIANVLALVIREENDKHEQKWTTKLLRFFGFSAQNEFISQLHSIETRIQQQGDLPKAFAAHDLPLLIQALNRVRDTLRNEQPTKFATEHMQALVDISTLINHVEISSTDKHAASLAVFQLLHKFDNENYYKNHSFYEQLKAEVGKLQAMGIILPDDDHFDNHLKRLNHSIRSVHAGVEAIKLKGAYI